MEKPLLTQSVREEHENRNSEQNAAETGRMRVILRNHSVNILPEPGLTPNLSRPFTPP